MQVEKGAWDRTGNISIYRRSLQGSLRRRSGRGRTETGDRSECQESHGGSDQQSNVTQRSHKDWDPQQEGQW